MTTPIDTTIQRLARPGRIQLGALPEGYDAQVLPRLANGAGHRGLVHVCRDDQHLAELEEQIAYFAPELSIKRFPAWDCLPYDRVSPSADILAKRLSVLAELIKPAKEPFLFLTTINAVLQRVVPKSLIQGGSFTAVPGQNIKDAELQAFLINNGYSRCGTVVDRGDFAVRGGLIDIFPPGADQPVRLDFFGDTLESIRQFDAQSQRSTAQLKSLTLHPANEVLLNKNSIATFRTAYAEALGGIDLNDPLYESITNARIYQGMEHWLPLFHSELATLFDYVPEAVWSLSQSNTESMAARHDQVEEFYDARREAMGKQSFGAAPYKPLKPERLYLSETEWNQLCADRTILEISPFENPSRDAISFSGKQGRSFAAERAEAGGNVYDAVRQHTEQLRKANKRTLISCWSDGSAERLSTILHDHGLAPLVIAKNWAEATKHEVGIVSLIVLPLEQGFETPEQAVISEQDILGDRLVRRARKAKKAADFLSELSSLSPGDLMVHVDHGI